MPDLVSVIVPALNEAQGIVKTLESVRSQAVDHELIVVDGESSDETPDLAGRYGRVLTSGRGRARQMNAGAAAATGDVLLFLHADTLLPPHTLDAVCQALEDPNVDGGAFRLRFDRSSPLLRFYAFCTRFPIPRICFGDRAHFVRRSVFEELGGFPAVPLFEDLELVRMLHDRGSFRFLDQHVVTSARRFQEAGPLRQQLRNTYLWLHYIAGSDLDALKHHYPYDA